MVVTIGSILLCIILPITVITPCCCLYYFCAYKPSTRNLPVRIRNNRIAVAVQNTSPPPNIPLQLGAFTRNNSSIDDQVNHRMYTTQNSNVYPMPQTIESTYFTSTHTQQHMVIMPQAYPTATLQSPPPYSSLDTAMQNTFH